MKRRHANQTGEAGEPVETAAAPLNLSVAERRYALLSGLGFYRLSKERQRLLWYAMGITLALHLLVLLAFGGWVIMRTHAEQATVFEVPPPVRTYQPRQLEHRVKVQQRQRSSSRPAVIPRLVSMKPSDINLPEIKTDPKLIHTTFQPKFTAVTGMGLGAGLGTGYGADGFGQGMSSYNFFGIRAGGERVAILVDVSVSMVEDEKGGPAGYMAVKRRLGEVLDALAGTALFGVVVFADAANCMEHKLVLANDENRTRAKQFLRPYNTDGNWGLTQGNVQASSVGQPAAGGTTRLDLALTAAFQMGADTILIISDGAPRVKRTYSTEQMQAFQQQRQAWQAANAATLANWDAAYGGEKGVASRVWVEAPKSSAKEPRKPAKPPSLKEGVAPHAPAAPAKGHWEVVHTHGYAPRPAPPPIPDAGDWSLADFAQHLSLLYDVTYKPQGRKQPVIHCIGYQIDKEGGRFLKELAKIYHGEYRRVSKLQ